MSVRHYEIATVLHPDLEIDLDSTLKKIEDVILKAAGSVTKKDSWGKRKLAYRINGQDWGIFVFFTVELEPAKVSSVEASLKIMEEVMRHLVVSLEHPKLVAKHKPSKKAAKSPKTETEEKIDKEESK